MKFKEREFIEVTMEDYNDRESGRNNFSYFIDGKNKYFLESKEKCSKCGQDILK